MQIICIKPKYYQGQAVGLLSMLSISFSGCSKSSNDEDSLMISYVALLGPEQVAKRRVGRPVLTF